MQNGAGSRSDIKLTSKQLAYELGVCERTIDAWRKKRIGPPYYREVNRIYYYREDIEAWRQNAKWG
jgi:DNA-binding transcriptional MerR regulator